MICIYIYTYTHTHTYAINTGGRSGRLFFCQYISTMKTCGMWLETQSLGALGCGRTRTTPQSTWRRAAFFSGKKSCGWLPSLCVGTTCMVSRHSVSLKRKKIQIYVGLFWGRVDGLHLCAMAQHVWWVMYRSLLKVFLQICVCLLEVAQWRSHLCVGSTSSRDFLKVFFQLCMGPFWGRVDGCFLYASALHVQWAAFRSLPYVFFQMCRSLFKFVGLFWDRVDSCFLYALALHVQWAAFRSLP